MSSERLEQPARKAVEAAARPRAQVRHPPCRRSRFIVAAATLGAAPTFAAPASSATAVAAFTARFASAAAVFVAPIVIGRIRLSIRRLNIEFLLVSRLYAGLGRCVHAHQFGQAIVEGGPPSQVGEPLSGERIDVATATCEL